MSRPYFADNQYVPTPGESSLRMTDRVAWLWGHCRRHATRIDATNSDAPTELQARLMALTGPAGSSDDGLWAQQIKAQPPSFWVVPSTGSDRRAVSAFVGPNPVVKPRMQVRLLSDHRKLWIEYWVDVVGASVAFFVLGAVGLVALIAAAGVLFSAGSQLRPLSAVLLAVGVFCLLFTPRSSLLHDRVWRTSESFESGYAGPSNPADSHWRLSRMCRSGARPYPAIWGRGFYPLR